MKKFLSVLLCMVFIFALVSFKVSADTTPKITVSSVKAQRGNTVDVKINITNNPGILAMAFCIGYDSSVLEYKNHTQGFLTNYNVKDHSEEGYVSFVNVEESETKQNGTMLTLSFKVKSNAPFGNYDIVVLNNNPEKYADSLHNSFANANEQFVVPTVTNGTVTIVEKFVITPGDVNDDGSINNRDYALLMQYINGWNVEIVLDNATVNGDNAINNKDCALLMQYLNGWSVELKGAPTESDKNSYGNQGPMVFF